MEMKLRSLEGHLKHRKELILKLCDVTEENKKFVLDFCNENEVNGISVFRRCSYMRLLYYLFQHLGQKPIKETDKQDIVDFFNKVRRKGFGDNRVCKDKKEELLESTMNDYKAQIKHFYRNIFEMEKGQYPECVKWLKLSRRTSKPMLPEELPTVEEVNKIAQSADNPRDIAFVRVLYESACRISELLSLQMKHVTFDDYGAVLIVGGKRDANKTGMRRVRITTSEPDLRIWINCHPRNNDPEAPLWMLLNNRNYASNMKYSTAIDLIKKLKRKAHVKKRCNIHSFRHTRLTELAKRGFNEAELMIIAGHSKGSEMPSTYIHLSGGDVDKKLLAIAGKIKETETENGFMKVEKPCPRCNTISPIGFKFCGKCAFVLNNKDAIRKEIEKQEIDNTLDFIAKDPILSEKFLELINEAREQSKSDNGCY